jgi:hypothetical protein
MLEIFLVLGASVREDDLSLEATVLAADLKFFGVDLDHSQIGVLSADELHGFGQFFDGGHGG